MATMTSTHATPATAGPDTGDRASRVISPRADIYETDKAFVLLADLPGVGPDGLDVEVDRETLIIRGRVERPATTPEYQEFELGDYYRAFLLTEDLQTDAVRARLRDGVLALDVPKSPETQPKKIQVRTE